MSTIDNNNDEPSNVHYGSEEDYELQSPSELERIYSEETQEKSQNTPKASLEIVSVTSLLSASERGEETRLEGGEDEKEFQTPFRSNNRISGRPRLSNIPIKSTTERNTKNDAKNQRQKYNRFQPLGEISINH